MITAFFALCATALIAVGLAIPVVVAVRMIVTWVRMTWPHE